MSSANASKFAEKYFSEKLFLRGIAAAAPGAPKGIGTTANSPTATFWDVAVAARKQKRANIAAALLSLLFPEITR
jgi:hypothetical protein